MTKVFGVRLPIAKHTEFIAKCKTNRTTPAKAVKTMIDKYTTSTPKDK